MKENINYYSFLFLAAVLSPISVLAPLGTWIPSMIISFVLLHNINFNIKDIHNNKLNLGVLFFFAWIYVNFIILNLNLEALEKIIHLSLIFLSGYILERSIIKTKNFNYIIITFSFSLIISAAIIMLDVGLNIGLKLWLSKNLDFNNFNNFYSLKSWITLKEFSLNNADEISNYFDNTYDRGIAIISVLALPIGAFCFFYNYRILGILVILTCFLTSLTFYNYTVLIGYLLVFIVSLLLILKRNLNINFFLLFFAIYFITAPLILGQLDYKNFAAYETNIEEEKKAITKKYINCKDRGLKKFEAEYKKNSSVKKDCIKNIYIFKNFLFSKMSMSKVIDFSKYQYYHLSDKIIHRLMIWSFSKEKIFDRPIFGYGVFKTRSVGEEYKIIDKDNNKISAIPLHTHNGILQIWLELGGIGVLLFYYLIFILMKRIHSFSKISRNYSIIVSASLIQIFFIGQLSFGVWQSWWMSIIAITIVLYSLLFTKVKTLKDFSK